jgi:hypothetical protein
MGNKNTGSPSTQQVGSRKSMGVIYNPEVAPVKHTS